jgi:OOP family OmpA-OmpF porin
MVLRKKIAAVLLASAFSVPAVAADIGWYGLGSLGMTSWKLDKDFEDTTSGSDGKWDKSDIGWKLGAGAMFNRNFGVEAGYVDLGKAKFTGSGAFSGLSLSAKASGIFIAGIGAFPVNNQLSIFGKLGLINANVKDEITAPGINESAKKTLHEPDVRPRRPIRLQ